MDELDEITKDNKVDYSVVYGEFMYKAGSWPYERRIVCKVEKPENQMVYMYTFIVTNMDSSPEYLVKFYCTRGLMENFIKESKSGFDFASVSSHTRIVNANRLQVHALAYNIFNWFRRLALSANMRKQRIDTVRLKLLKIAAKVIRSARYITFKLCSSCPYKNEFYETLSNIGISAFYFSSSVNFALLFSIIINFLLLFSLLQLHNCVISVALMLYQMAQNPPTLPCNKTNFYKPIELRST